MSYPILDLLERHGFRMKRKSSANGGEWCCACPRCGGKDRFLVCPEKGSCGKFHCLRGCGWHGDMIDLLRELDGLSFQEAREVAGHPQRLLSRTSCQGGSLPPSATPPSIPVDRDRWVRRAGIFCWEGQEILWSTEGVAGLEYLRQRGFTEEILRQARLGFNPLDRHDPPESWGIREAKPIWIPAGIVINSCSDGTVMQVGIRRISKDSVPKYVLVRYSEIALFNADAIRCDRPVVLLEGAFDALSIIQTAADLACAVATSGTDGSRSVHWIAELALAPLVLVSFDNDHAGEKAAVFWTQILANSIRWRPYWGDPNQMLQDGCDVRKWVQAGLEYAGDCLKRRP